jgi:hypothetical protein
MAAGKGLLPDPENLFSGHRGPFPYLQHNILSVFSKNNASFIKAPKLHKALGNKELTKAIKRLNKKLERFGLKISRHSVYLVEEVKPKSSDKQMGLFQ